MFRSSPRKSERRLTCTQVVKISCLLTRLRSRALLRYHSYSENFGQSWITCYSYVGDFSQNQFGPTGSK